jgi:uncharacterized protein
VQLTPIEVRILGALIEKESTTPDVYPLSLNALVNACNQTSNRDPVMELTEDSVRWALNNLRQQSLVRAIQRSDSRVMKYQHLLHETLTLDGPQLAVMCVLMLRGPQTSGEIKGRTNRLADFARLSDVEQVLGELVQRGLAAEIPRRPGQKEARFAHLLSGPVAAAPLDQPDALHVHQPRVEDGSAVAATLDRVAQLEATVEELRRELTDLRSHFEEFRLQFG